MLSASRALESLYAIFVFGAQVGNCVALVSGCPRCIDPESTTPKSVLLLMMLLSERRGGGTGEIEGSIEPSLHDDAGGAVHCRAQWRTVARRKKSSKGWKITCGKRGRGITKHPP
jgi:hypothetical protein